MFPARRLTLPLVALRQTLKVAEPKTSEIKQLNQYLLVKRVGRGATSKVYAAIDRNTNELYAVKVWRKTKHGILEAQIRREIEMMTRLANPHVVSMREVLKCRENGNTYMVLELADCGSLMSAIQRGVNFSDECIASVGLQVAQGLKFLHERNICHNDIKPSNILLFSNGRVKLADFGIVRSFQSADSVLGSPGYQAPEFLDDTDSLDPRKEDVWSLGVTLYEMKFGRLPFFGDDLFQIVKDARKQCLTFPSHVSLEFERVIRGMLRVDPAERLSLDEVMLEPFFAGAQELTVLPFKPERIEDMHPNDVHILAADQNPFQFM